MVLSGHHHGVGNRVHTGDRMDLPVFGRRYRKGYRFLHGVVVAFVGAFFSGITPSATGGQFAQAYIMKKQGIKVSDGASILWADFIVYQTTMMIYVTILFLLRFSYYSAQNAWFNLILLGYLINVVVICALYTMALFPRNYIRLSGVIVNLLARIHLVKNREETLANWNLQLASFTTEIKKPTKDKRLILETAGINVLRMTLQFSLPFFIALMMGIHLQPGQLIDVIALSSFVMMANSFIPIPGASGGTEVVRFVIWLFVWQWNRSGPAVVALFYLSSGAHLRSGHLHSGQTIL